MFQKIFNFFIFILGGHFSLPQRANNGKRGIHPTSKLNETRGFQCLGHSNWTICSPLSSFCSRRFSTFSPSYWEANSYYPRGVIMGKGNSHNLKIRWDRGVSVPEKFKLDYLRRSREAKILLSSWNSLLFWIKPCMKSGETCILFKFLNSSSIMTKIVLKNTPLICVEHIDI